MAASFSMAAPDAWSRLTITSALAPLASICSAMDFIVDGLPLAFLMSQLRLYFLHAAASAVGSAVTQRGEDVVSGRMMPTLAPLPFALPPLVVLELDDEDDEEFPAGWEGWEAAVVVPPPPPLEPQAASAKAAATPIAATDTLLLRMQ